MIPLLNVEVFIFLCCIFSCCFLTKTITVEVTSENYLEHFIFKAEKNLLKSKSTNIHKISSHAFNFIKNCKIFKIINLKQLSTLPENLFHKKEAFQNVTNLDFRNTALIHLPENLFRDLKQLETFHLFHSKLESIHSNLFQSNTKLREVSIWSNNLLKSLPRDLFRNNRQLTEIFIGRNSLLEKLPHLFQNSVKESKIWFQVNENNLKFIEYETFSNINISEIKYLDISDNFLVCLPDYFLNATKFAEDGRRKLLITGNCLDTSSQICKSGRCKNRPEEDCKDAKASTNIRRCQQGYNKVMTGEVTSQNYLNYFSFMNNVLYSKNSSIEKISSKAFNSVRNCNVFQIEYMEQLSTLPEKLFHKKEAFQNLTSVGLLYSGINHLPEHLFRELGQLKHVDIYDSKLKSLPSKLFQSNTQLNLVFISDNKLLNSIPADLFKHNKQLKIISIRNNTLLNVLPPQLFQNVVGNNLWLQLSKNSLKFIEHETLVNMDFQNIESLDITNNYLVCLPDYFVNVTHIPENTRNKIDLSGNCFNESSQICQLYKCNNRPAKQCEGARNSTNIRKCQQGYEHTKYEIDNDTVISKTEDNNGKNISEDTKDELKSETIEISLIIFYVLLFCLTVLLAISFYLLYKRRGQRIIPSSKPNQNSPEGTNCDFYDYVSNTEN